MFFFEVNCVGVNSFSIFGDKTNPNNGFFHFYYTNPYPNNMPKVGQQWYLSDVRPEPIVADLGDFEYVADTTPFTVKL